MSYRKVLLFHFWRKLLGQTSYPSLSRGEYLRGDIGQVTEPRQDKDVRWKLIPSCSSQWFAATFLSEHWPWIPSKAFTPCGAEDGRCKLYWYALLYGSRNLKARLHTKTLSSPAPKSVGGLRLMSLCCVSRRTPQVGIDTACTEHTETYITAAGVTCGLKGFLSPLRPGSLTFFVKAVFSFF